MGALNTYPDDTATAADDKFLTLDNAGTTKLTAASTVKDYVLPTGGLATAKYADDSVTDDKLDYPRWYQEIGRTTLGSASDTITVSSIPARKYLRLVINLIPSGTSDAVMRFNNDSGSNYAQIHSSSFSAITTQTSQTHIFVDNGTPTMPSLITVDIVNNQSNEKLVMLRQLSAATGAANAPSSLDAYGKWANTAALINRIDLINVQTGDFAAGSQITVLGHD